MPALYLALGKAPSRKASEQPCQLGLAVGFGVRVRGLGGGLGLGLRLGLGLDVAVGGSPKETFIHL